MHSLSLSVYASFYIHTYTYSHTHIYIIRTQDFFSDTLVAFLDINTSRGFRLGTKRTLDFIKFTNVSVQRRNKFR